MTKSSLDLEKALKAYPALKQAASELRLHLKNYIQTDRLFRQTFLELFNEPLIFDPWDDKWRFLARLYELAGCPELIGEPILRLEHNNERCDMVCAALAMVLGSGGDERTPRLY